MKPALLLSLTLLSLATNAAPPGRELAVVWPAPNADTWKLLRQLDATAVITPLSVQKPGGAGIRLIAELNSRVSLEEVKEDLTLARKLGYDGAALYATGDEASLRALLQQFKGFVEFVYLKPEQAGWNVAPARAVFLGGLWPGLQAADTATASATEKPWINANLHIYAWLRASFPNRPAWLRTEAPKPDTRYDSTEVALTEAFASGGNVILQFPEMYREGLRKAAPRARQSWDSLCNLASTLRKTPTFDATASGSSTAILTGPFDEFEELLNLPFRNNLAPRVVPASAPAIPKGTRVLVAVNQEVAPGVGRLATEFAKSGGILVAAPADTKDTLPWLTAANPTKVKDEKPWSLWELGQGRIYRFPEPIIEPSEFSYDLREISGLDNPSHTGLHGLDFRVWNVATVLGVLYEAASGGKQLVLISYGQGMNRDFLVGVRGKFKSAVLRQPGAEPQPLELMQRGWFVECNINSTGRLAVIELQGAQP